MNILERNIAADMNQVDESTIKEIDKKLGQLQKELLRFVNNKEDYSILADEIYCLRDKKVTITKNVGYVSQKQRMANMIEFLKQQKDIVEDYDEQLVRKLIETITVYDEKFTVTFKSGLTLDVDM